MKSVVWNCWSTRTWPVSLFQLVAIAGTRHLQEAKIWYTGYTVRQNRRKSAHTKDHQTTMSRLCLENSEHLATQDINVLPNSRAAEHRYTGIEGLLEKAPGNISCCTNRIYTDGLSYQKQNGREVAQKLLSMKQPWCHFAAADICALGVLAGGERNEYQAYRVPWAFADFPMNYTELTTHHSLPLSKGALKWVNRQ